MHRDEYVALYGGKAGLHKFLRDSGDFDEHLLPTAYVLPGERTVAKTKSALHGYSGDMILRGSHRCDLTGLVDVLNTYSKISDYEWLQWKSEDARANARSEKIRKYAESEDPSYDGQLVLMVQPQLKAVGEITYYSGVPYCGSIVAHPNIDDCYIVSVVDKLSIMDKHTGTCVYHDEIEENKRTMRTGWSTRTPVLKIAEKIIPLYERACAKFDYAGMSLQMVWSWMLLKLVQ